MKILLLTLCTFANDYSIDLACNTYRATTDNCAAKIEELRRNDPGFTKESSCLRIIEKQPVNISGDGVATAILY